MELTLEDKDYFYLYKHMRSSDGSRAVIGNGTIRFTNPKEFNDPFDCFFNVSDDYFLTATQMMSVYLRNGQKPSSPAKRIQDGKKVKNILKNQIKSGEYQGYFHDRIGICCLNKSPLNILMWSHYADNHKGFMVELKFPKSVSHGLEYKDFVPFPVEYSDIYPSLTKKDRLGNSSVNKVYLTKSTDWNYEKEQRIIDHDKGSGIHPYPRNYLLCSVIAGLKISDGDFLLLKESIRKAEEEIGRDIPIYKAEKLMNEYALTVKGHTRLDKQKA